MDGVCIMKKFVVTFLVLMNAYGSLHAEQKITVEYEAATKGNAQSAIKAVRCGKKELPHVTLADLLDKTKKAIYLKSDAERKSWNRFTMAQVAAFAAATAVYIKNYINDDQAVRLKELLKSQTWAQRINADYCKIGTGLGLAAAAMYPLVRYWNYFQLQDIEFYLPSEEVDGRVMVFRRKTYSHSVRYGDYVQHFYNTSGPIGYMTIKEKEKAFKIAAQANKRVHVSTMNMCLCLGGLLFAVSAQ